MSNIIDFQKRERLIWTCGHCGCSTFYLYSDETTECAGCGHASEGGEWVTPLAEEKKSPEKNNAGSINSIAIGSVEFAKRRVLKKINDNSGELAFVASWFEDGGMTSWSGAQTDEQKDWVVRRLQELAKAIDVKPIGEE
jgi:hypothetical protein